MTKALTTEEFIPRAKNIHGNTYDYSKTKYIKSTIKVIIICKKHGPFEQAPFSHMNGNGCPKCMPEKIGNALRLSKSEFIDRAKAIHGNKYVYNRVIYRNIDTNVSIWCKKHKKWFIQTPYSHLQGAGCKHCRYEKASKEKTLSKEQFILISNSVHDHLYDYSKVVYKKNSIKVQIICKIHGIFEQTPNMHMQGQGCPYCAGKHTKTTEEFIKQAELIHGNKYDYSKTKYINTITNVTIICKKHGPFEQLPCNHLSKKYGCPSCGQILSKGEKDLRKWIHSLGIKTIRGRKIIENFELDIYIPKHKLAIEYNGLYWHSSRTKSQNYHKIKTDIAEKNGIHLMHFWDFEWKEKQPIVKSIIKNKLGLHEHTIYARNTKLDLNVPSQEARKFCENNHIHGFRGGQQRIGLRFNNKLVALMITNTNGEMVRFVIKINTNIPGGFSRLLKYSNVSYSYVDRRIFTGNGYLKNGFKLIKTTIPNFFYVKKDVYAGSRQQFQKHKLNEKLKEFDHTKSANENMYKNGFDRVYDCGHFLMKKGGLRH